MRSYIIMDVSTYKDHSPTLYDSPVFFCRLFKKSAMCCQLLGSRGVTPDDPVAMPDERSHGFSLTAWSLVHR